MAAPLTPYELERRNRMEENRRFLESLGVDDAVRNLDKAMTVKRVPRRTPGPKKVLAPVPVGPTRRSSRLEGKAAGVYKELSEREALLIDGPEPKRRGRQRAVSARQPRAGYGPEEYTDEHKSALGECCEEWVLFQDGYAADGARVYDMVNGKTCHQCRQKTLGKRTWCNGCESLNGQFCGDCLYMRYGENILEVNANPDWSCPSCRDLCNCSICRNRKGWCPTGQLYRTAIDQGYKSVAHYLVATRRAPPSTLGASDQSPNASPVASAEQSPEPVLEQSPLSPQSTLADISASKDHEQQAIGSPDATPQKAPTRRAHVILSPASALTSAEPASFTLAGGKTPQEVEGGSSLPTSEVTNEGTTTDCPTLSDNNNVQHCPTLESVKPKPLRSLSGAVDTPLSRGVKACPTGQTRKELICSPGGDSCESGLSTEAGGNVKRVVLERKFRSLLDITGEVSRPTKRRRGGARM